MSKEPILTLDIDSRWFKAIADHEKKIEGRQGSLLKGRFKHLSKGDKIKFKSSANEMITTVLAVRQYPNLKRYLVQEGLRKTLPGVESLKDGLAIYHQYYSDDSTAKAGGILAIELK